MVFEQKTPAANSLLRVNYLGRIICRWRGHVPKFASFYECEEGWLPIAWCERCMKTLPCANTGLLKYDERPRLAPNG